MKKNEGYAKRIVKNFDIISINDDLPIKEIQKEIKFMDNHSTKFGKKLQQYQRVAKSERLYRDNSK